MLTLTTNRLPNHRSRSIAFALFLAAVACTDVLPAPDFPPLSQATRITVLDWNGTPNDTVVDAERITDVVEYLTALPGEWEVRNDESGFAHLKLSFHRDDEWLGTLRLAGPLLELRVGDGLLVYEATVPEMIELAERVSEMM